MVASAPSRRVNPWLVLSLVVVLAALAANFERIFGAVSNLLAPAPANNIIIVAPTGSETV
jgi:hypothetical protein